MLFDDKSEGAIDKGASAAAKVDIKVLHQSVLKTQSTIEQEK